MTTTGRPNVVLIVLDDLGFGQFGCFGSDIATPTVDRLAQDGLRYNRFHVTALCSPTRAALLTGRNHHAVGMGFLADIPTVDPGYTGRIPSGTPTLPLTLRDSGYSTLAVGKWHLTPTGERSGAGPFQRWPLGLGFERFYGFLRGDANQWAPELVRDNSYVEPPATPEQGYHLTEDLADEAIRMVVNQQTSAPGKPFFLYFATGAMHAPHHVPKPWADAYAGRFDAGWDRWRDQLFARQLRDGLVPSGTTLTARPSWVPPWDDLTGDEQRLYARMHEVYAGFLTHTDAQIGRLVAALERLGVLDNTLLVVTSDNGASAEGGITGTVNEHRFTHRVRDELADNIARLDDWGGVHTYPHYAWGWAWAGNTPFKLWKRYTWLGGIRVPLVVHWPQRIGNESGHVRGQFAHAVDLMPTVLDACGVDAPPPSDGASMVPTLTGAGAPDPRSIQYFEMLGSRSIVCNGWKATTDHVSLGVMDEEELMSGSRDFVEDRWSLYRLDDDFAEAHDLADQYPEILDLLKNQWALEAERNNVAPLTDSLVGRLARLLSPDYPPQPAKVLYPDGGPVSDEALPSLAGGGAIIADADVPPESVNGVLFALGDWIGGLAAYAVDGVLNVAVAQPQGVVKVVADLPLSPGRHQIGCLLRALPDGGATIEAVIDDTVVGTATSAHPIPLIWQHGGTSITLGRDRGLPVSDDYQPPFPWTGTLHQVHIKAGSQRANAADVLRAALHAD